ncbi:flavin reductase family protein [Hydrogenophaga sp.]|uniref:flavin reductase family protein n=1 Tax=Hydrogenophaga sp. TaxID=1904254 RepID=UPI002724900C|nr:flavin reductase family protein [Hydrogenophaga sp.]MDO9437901.1 flavin reductase family protein [Hydrogenophaga sp.]
MTSDTKVGVPRDQWDRLFATPGILAVITTIDALGRVNAGAFATCVRATHNPMEISFTTYSEGVDTLANIRVNGEFVVNLPSFDPAQLAKVCTVGLPFEGGVNELEKAALTALPSTVVAPPCIAEFNRHFECKVVWTKDWSGRTMVMGEVVAACASADCMDAEGFLRFDVANPALYCGAPYFNRPPYEHQFVQAAVPMRVTASYQGPEVDAHLARVKKHQ